MTCSGCHSGSLAELGIDFRSLLTRPCCLSKEHCGNINGGRFPEGIVLLGGRGRSQFAPSIGSGEKDGAMLEWEERKIGRRMGRSQRWWDRVMHSLEHWELESDSALSGNSI